ncbi:unnamed protein product [marine sediment metagenome]|uniref:Uncharacterized protein n=1 Tax=marine sediment metagenome TaxID=412755 RepID=X0V008_9ZZZZ
MVKMFHVEQIHPIMFQIEQNIYIYLIYIIYREYIPKKEVE